MADSWDDRLTMQTLRDVYANLNHAEPAPPPAAAREEARRRAERAVAGAVFELGLRQCSPKVIQGLLARGAAAGSPAAELTTEHIKSHLQKYRLLMQKRARQAPAGGASGGAAAAAAGGGAGASDALPGAASSDLGGGGGEPEGELEQHLARQEMNLKVQMELQTKLHRQVRNMPPRPLAPPRPRFGAPPRPAARPPRPTLSFAPL